MVEHKKTKRTPGQRLTKPKQLELYMNILEYHVIGGLGYRQTAEVCGVDFGTISYHLCNIKSKPGSGQFWRWLKEKQPERYDRDYAIQRFIERSENRRTSAMALYAENRDALTRVKLHKEMREEDLAQLKLLQDIGVVEAKSAAHTQVPIMFTWGEPEKKP